MTNFLSSLITKTVETAPIVKPRPQSLYEPVTRAPEMPPVGDKESIGQAPVAQSPAPAHDHEPAKPVEAPLPPARKHVPPGEPSPPATAQESTAKRAQEPASHPRRSHEETAKEGATGPRSQTRPPAPKAEPSPPTPPTVPSPRPRSEETHPEGEAPAPNREPPATITVAERKEDVEPMIRELFVERVVAREETTPPTESVSRPPGRAIAPLRPQPTMPSSRTAHQRDGQPDDRRHDLSTSEMSQDKQPAPTRPPVAPDSPQKTNTSPAVPSIPDRQDRKRLLSKPVRALYPQATVPVLTPRQPVEKQQPSEPEPTVRVHIGRIEVRATPPPEEPAKKPGRKTPVMSLDDYLERRNGRGKPG